MMYQSDFRFLALMIKQFNNVNRRKDVRFNKKQIKSLGEFCSSCNKDFLLDEWLKLVEGKAGLGVRLVK